MTTFNDVITHVQAMIDANRARARESGVVEATALFAVVNALTNVRDELVEAAPDPGLYIAVDVYGDHVLWSDDDKDLPLPLISQWEKQRLWDAVIDGRFPVREEATDGVQ